MKFTPDTLPQLRHIVKVQSTNAAGEQVVIEIMQHLEDTIAR
jgi:hypothetical protein